MIENLSGDTQFICTIAAMIAKAQKDSKGDHISKDIAQSLNAQGKPPCFPNMLGECGA